MSVVTGTCKWSKLLNPSEEDGTFKSKYSIDLYDIDEKGLAQLAAEEVEPKVDKDGETFYRFWTAGMYKGKVNPPVRLIDKHKNKLDVEPGNGSVVRVQYTPTPWKFLKKTGVFGALQGVQVINLVNRYADELDAVEDEGMDDDIPF